MKAAEGAAATRERRHEGRLRLEEKAPSPKAAQSSPPCPEIT